MKWYLYERCIGRCDVSTPKSLKLKGCWWIIMTGKKSAGMFLLPYPPPLPAPHTHTHIQTHTHICIWKTKRILLMFPFVRPHKNTFWNSENIWEKINLKISILGQCENDILQISWKWLNVKWNGMEYGNGRYKKNVYGHVWPYSIQGQFWSFGVLAFFPKYEF